MKDISPSAQVVRSDLAQIMNELHQRCRVSISRTDTLPITLETNDVSLQAGINSLCAATLRAAAQEVIPEDDLFWKLSKCETDLVLESVRNKLLAIADELEAIS